MEPEIQPEAVPGRIERRTYVIRCAIATAVVLATFIYLIGIALGRVPQQQRLGAADVWMIVVAALAVGVLVRPELLNRLTHLKVGGVELDWLQKLQADQQKQRDELDDVRFVLTLLLKESEQEHLRNLEIGNTQRYVGFYALRNELRRLRTLGLIRNCKDRTIGEMTDNRKFDLKDLVELTDRGRHYLERLGEYKEDKD